MNQIAGIIIAILVLVVSCCSISALGGIGGTWYLKKCEEPLENKDKIGKCLEDDGIYDFKNDHCNHGEKVDEQRKCWGDNGNAFYNFANKKCMPSHDKMTECFERKGIYDFSTNDCNHGENVDEELTDVVSIPVS